MLSKTATSDCTGRGREEYFDGRARSAEGEGRPVVGIRGPPRAANIKASRRPESSPGPGEDVGSGTRQARLPAPQRRHPYLRPGRRGLARSLSPAPLVAADKRW